MKAQTVSMRLLAIRWGFCVGVLFALSPVGAEAQSVLVGTVKDTTGAVLPGATIEASSPALIEKTRSTVTNDQGQYRLVDLRPGTYVITFTLPGFSTFQRNDFLLVADFTATVNAELRIGSVEETITVTGQSPLVDVQQTTRRVVLSRELLESVPTGRDVQSIGVSLPAVTAGRFDVAGSNALQQGGLAAYGGSGGDLAITIDGLNVLGMSGTGGTMLGNHNATAAAQEVTYQMAGGSAETQTGGIQVNLIPKEGGNQFRGAALGLYSTNGLQGNNLTDDLRARGFTVQGKMDKLWDVSPEIGGPIVRDRIWFFHNYRNWTFNSRIGNVFNKDGSQAVDKSIFQAYTTRVTIRVSEKNKLAVATDMNPRYRPNHGIEVGNVTPEGSRVYSHPFRNPVAWPIIYQMKWTSTLTPKLLLEMGGVRFAFRHLFRYQPSVRQATCFTAWPLCAPGTDYGDVSKVNLLTGIRYNAGPFETSRLAETDPNYDTIWPKNGLTNSLTYVSGAHAIKIGMRLQWGYNQSGNTMNGDLTQNYRNGVPDSVDVAATPSLTRSNLDRDLGIFVQDSWRVTNRLTLNPGIRFEQLKGSQPALDIVAGRFMPARHFDEIKNLPNFKDIAPRFGAAFDLFGNGRTGITGSIGKYTQQDQVSFTGRYSPSVAGSDRRTWTDRNGDDIAQESEIGPSQNATFGIARNRRPAPGIRRPYQVLGNVGIQHELRTGLAVSVAYFRREYKRMFWTKSLVIPPEAFGTGYTQVGIPDPRGNGETVTVYNLNRQFLGQVDELDLNSENNFWTYNGVDLTVNIRTPKGSSLIGGLSVGKQHIRECDVTDPNLLRGCEREMPYIPQVKLTGTQPLPYGLVLSGVFQSMPGIQESRFLTEDQDNRIIYLVNRTNIPTLTQSNVPIRLDKPGTRFMNRLHQLDISLAKNIQMGRVRMTPQVDLFNALNVSPVTRTVQTWGPSLDRPQLVLPARLLRFGARVNF